MSQKTAEARLRNVGVYLQIFTASHPSSFESLLTLLWETQCHRKQLTQHQITGMKCTRSQTQQNGGPVPCVGGLYAMRCKIERWEHGAVLPVAHNKNVLFTIDEIFS